MHWRQWLVNEQRLEEEEIAAIYDGVTYNERLRVCFDTCHTSDAGYDVREDFASVIEQFDRIIGKDQIAVFHINDSKNPQGAHKDRHENIGFGEIGYDCLRNIVYNKDFEAIPKILEKQKRGHLLRINMKLRC